MRTLSEAEMISSLVDDIYDAALDRARWPAVLEKIVGFVGGSAANLFYHDRAGSDVGVYLQWGNDPDYERLYISKYAAINPLFPATMLYPVGTVLAQSDVVARVEFQKSHFYREWMRPQSIIDAVGGIVDKTANSIAMLVIQRCDSDGIVDEETRRRFGLLLPHVRRALLLGQVISCQETDVDAFGNTLSLLSDGVFLVDAAMKIVFANDAGAAMLARADLVQDARGALKTHSRALNRLLHDRCLSAAGFDDAMPNATGEGFPLEAGGERWLIHVLPLTSGDRRRTGISRRAVAAIFVRKASIDAMSALEMVARLYHLTPSEARVLRAVVEIGAVRDIAAALGILQTTVKTHLQHIFVKTGTHRQADLVRLVAGHASPFRRMGNGAEPGLTPAAAAAAARMSVEPAVAASKE